MEQHCFGKILSPAVSCTHGVLYYDQLLFTLRFDTQKIKKNSGDNDAEWLNGRDSRDGRIVVYSYSVRVVFRLSDQSRSPRRDTLKDFTAKMGGRRKNNNSNWRYPGQILSAVRNLLYM